MAEPAKKLDVSDKVQNFDEGQLAFLNGKTLEDVRAYFTPDIEGGDPARISGIQKETREKIMSAVPNNILLFQRALAKQPSDLQPNVAFKRAFQSVYGRFLLESESPALEKPDSGFMTTLGRVLRFSLDKTGLKSRPELQAALAEVSLLDLNKDDDSSISKEFASTKAQRLDELRSKKSANAAASNTARGTITNLESQVTSLSNERNQLARSLENLNGDLSADAEVIAKWDVKIWHLIEEINALKSILPSSKTTLEEVEKEQARFKGIDDLLVENQKLFEELNRARELRPDLKEAIVKKSQEILECRTLIDQCSKALDSGDNLDVLRPKLEVLGRRLERLIREKNSLLGQSTELPSDLVAKFQENERKLVDLTKNIANALPSINDKLSQILDNLDGLSATDSNIEQKVAELMELDRQKKEFEAKKAKIEEEIERSSSRLTEVDKAINQSNIDLRAEKSRLDALTTEQSELDEAISKVDKFGIVDWVMELAFKDAKSPVEILDLEVAKDNAEKKRQEIKNARAFFTSGEKLDALAKSFDTFGEFNADVEDIKPDSSLVLSPDELVMYDKGTSLTSRIEKLTEAIKSQELRRSKFSDPRNKDADTDTKIAEAGKKIGEFTRVLKQLKTLHEKAKSAYSILSEVVEASLSAEKLGFVFGSLNLKDVKKSLKGFDPDKGNFKAKDLLDLYIVVNVFFGNDIAMRKLSNSFNAKIAKADEEVSKTKQELDDATAANEKNKNLTDSQAAKRILGTIVGKKFPNLSPEEQDKVTKAILVRDVSTLATEKSYEDLAKRAGAEVFDVAADLGFKKKLIGFQYKVKDTVYAPFKDLGLKVDDFSDVKKIRSLFAEGKLDFKNSTFILAALELLSDDTPSAEYNTEQYNEIESLAKDALVDDLGCRDKMDNVAVQKIVDEAFDDQMKVARSAILSYSKHFDANHEEWDKFKILELNKRYEILLEKRRRGELDADKFEKELKDLITEAGDNDVLDKVAFSQDSIMQGYLNSAEAQWLKDQGYNVEKFLEGKLTSIGKTGVDLSLKYAWGATKLSLGLGLQSTLLPFRLAKYPLIVASKVAVAPINFVRKEQISTPSITGTIKADVLRVINYGTETVVGNAKGALEAVKTVPVENWKARGWDPKKYADRSENKIEDMAKEADEQKEKAKYVPVTRASEPFVDLEKYKAKIAEFDKVVTPKAA